MKVERDTDIAQQKGAGNIPLPVPSCTRTSRYLLPIFVILLSCFYFSRGDSVAQSTVAQPRPVEVQDVSDRNYHERVLQLLRTARHSVIVSMYLARPQDPESRQKMEHHPVDDLLRVLVEVARRGVSVTIFLNTHFKESGGHAAHVGTGPLFDELRGAGANVYLVSDSRRLHDKLIVVDERYVVEGSTNWSLLALRTNWESATLIDSPSLAQVKIARLGRLPLEGAKNPLEVSKPPDTGAEQPLQKGRFEWHAVAIPQEFVSNPKYLAAMIKKQDTRALQLYLLLLRESAAQGSSAFPLNLEATADQLAIPSDGSDAGKRRQVIKSLKKLEGRYHLLEMEFRFGKDAWVRLATEAPASPSGRVGRRVGGGLATETSASPSGRVGRRVGGGLASLSGGVFPMERRLFEELFLLSPKGQWALLASEYFRSQGQPLPARKDLSQRFSLGKETVRGGLRELEKHRAQQMESRRPLLIRQRTRRRNSGGET